jgi:hypothetical protein
MFDARDDARPALETFVVMWLLATILAHDLVSAPPTLAWLVGLVVATAWTRVF